MAKSRRKAPIGVPKKLKDAALIFAAFALVLALYIAALSLVGVKAVAADKPRCHSVTPQTYNRQVNRLDAITGKRHHRASRKVCKHTDFQKLKVRIRAARKVCLSYPNTRTVTASTYGTSAADDNGKGNVGDVNLFDYNDSFAELGWGTALGGIPNNGKRWVKAGRYVKRGTKRDVGPWHKGLANTIRGIDLHAPFAAALHVVGLKIVQVAKHNCWA